MGKTVYSVDFVSTAHSFGKSGVFHKGERKYSSYADALDTVQAENARESRAYGAGQEHFFFYVVKEVIKDSAEIIADAIFDDAMEKKTSTSLSYSQVSTAIESLLDEGIIKYSD